MANILVRNLDDDVADALKARAKANHRSLSAEIRQILTEIVQQPHQTESAILRRHRRDEPESR